MAEILEFRWHGRGGQGTVTAAKMFAEAALAEDKYIQAFPEYGPERAGAPLAAYNRLSDDPIYIHCAVKNPHYVAVVDATLLTGGVDVTNGAHEDATYLVNTTKPVTVEAVNAAFKAASESDEMLGILGYSDEPLVSMDYKADPRSSIFDALSTMVIGEKMVKVLSWYDNEWGYSNRCADLVYFISFDDEENQIL